MNTHTRSTHQDAVAKSEQEFADEETAACVDEDFVFRTCFLSDGIERKDSPVGFAPEQQGVKHSNVFFVISYLRLRHVLSLNDEFKLPLFPAGCHFSPLNVSSEDSSFFKLFFWIHFHEICRSSIRCTVAVLVHTESS